MMEKLSPKNIENAELVNYLMLYRLAYEENKSSDMWKKVQELTDEIVLRMNKGTKKDDKFYLNEKLRHLLLTAPKITGNYGEDTISYMEESLTFDEYDAVVLFYKWLNNNDLHYGWGNIDERWQDCFFPKEC